MKFNGLEIVNHHVAHIPMLFAFCKESGLIEEINAITEYVPGSSTFSPGFVASVMIVSIFSGVNPLYKMEYVWNQKVCDAFFGKGVVDSSTFNDDTFRRALDKLSECDCIELISRVGLRILAANNLPLDMIHLDATSISVYGVYDVEDNEDVPFIGYGYSKDHRPDLKQFKMGLGVTKGGIPVYGQLTPGSKSDNEWNRDSINRMNKIFGQEGFRNITFVGDSSTVSSYESIEQLKGVKFISRLPNTFGLTEELKEEAWNSRESMEDLGSISDHKDAYRYRAIGYLRKIKGQQLKLAVVYSSELNKKKRKTIEGNLNKKQIELEKSLKKVEMQAFACAEDAKRAGIKATTKVEKEGFLASWSIEEKHTFNYERPGRPSKESVRKEITEYYLRYEELYVNEVSMEKKLFMESTFILITSILESTNESILREYKGQNSVETNFKFIKNPLYLGRVFLKKPERVEALGYIFILVLMIAMWMTWRVRDGIQQEDGYLKYASNKLTRPSPETILMYFREIVVMEIGTERLIDAESYEGFEQIMRYMKIPVEVYTRPIEVC